MSERICVIGLGYVGLPTACVFADNGFDVTGVDASHDLVTQLNQGEVYTHEAGVHALFRSVLEKGTFRAVMKPVEADVFIIAVPTPHHADFTANLAYVQQAVHALVPVLEKGNTIIIESTVPPRTTRDVVAPVIEQEGFTAGEDIYIAHCPERVLPGNILRELYENNRIVGGVNVTSAQKAAAVYRRFVTGKVIETTAESAETAKLMENTYRNVNIALANELSKLSEGLEINPLEVIDLANEHPRVHIHQPGPGVGGHCIAVDPYFMVEKDPANAPLIQTALSVNESMPSFIVEQVHKVPAVKRIAVFGVAYKGDVNDVRESPAIKVIDLLMKSGYEVQCYDPYVGQENVPSIPMSSMEDTLMDADMMLLLTDHHVFREMDWEQVKRLMAKPIVLDAKHSVTDVPEIIDYYSFANLYALPANGMTAKIGR